MGNMQRLKDGEDFSSANFAKEKDFGFSGSAEGYDSKGSATPPFAAEKPTDNGEHAPGYAKGGHVHPHGHHVTHVEHHPHGTIMHHAHGGYTHHHPDGHVTHHMADGAPAMAHGGMHHMTGHSQEGTHVGKMAMNTPPRNPKRNPSERNAMPGGATPAYGVEPSAEPDEAGSEQGIPQLKHGGKARHHRGE